MAWPLVDPRSLHGRSLAVERLQFGRDLDLAVGAEGQRQRPGASICGGLRFKAGSVRRSAKIQNAGQHELVTSLTSQIRNDNIDRTCTSEGIF